MSGLMETSRPIFLMFVTPGCVKCADLLPFWGMVGTHWPDTAWVVDCGAGRAPASCERALADPLSMHGQPIFEIWTGAIFDRFEGRNPEALLAWLNARGGVWTAEQLQAVRARAPSAELRQRLLDAQITAAFSTTAFTSGRTPTDARDNTVPIPRVRAPSVGAFRRAHLAPSVPAIVEGVLDGWEARQWDEAAIQRKCGARPMGARCTQAKVTLSNRRRQAEL